MFQELYEKPGFWSEIGPNGDVVISTRVRFARNLANLSFPHKQNNAEFELLKSIVARFLSQSSYKGNLSVIALNEVDLHDKRLLRERNMITSEMETSSNSILVTGEDEHINILINEEDHIRIQVIRAGFQLMKAFQIADEIDSEMNKYISYAYSDDFGFLTSCPSNLGTGMRASTLLHLPSLSVMRPAAEISKLINVSGATIKGTSGEGNRTIGHMYQVSNRITLGKSEVDILESVDEATSLLVEMESEARDDYMSKHGRQLEDKIWRAYGVVKYSRLLNYHDAMEILSNLRLGIILSIIKKIDLRIINDLMVTIQWSHLQKSAGRLFQDDLECDTYRAEYLRSHVS